MKIEVKVCSTDGKESSGAIETVVLPKAKALFRAIKAIVALWLAGAISALIPVLHLVTIPALFLGGIAAAIYLYRRRTVITGSLACPACQREFDYYELTTAKEPEWPLQHACPECGRNMWVERIGSR